MKDKRILALALALITFVGQVLTGVGYAQEDQAIAEEVNSEWAGEVYPVALDEEGKERVDKDQAGELGGGPEDYGQLDQEEPKDVASPTDQDLGGVEVQAFSQRSLGTGGQGSSPGLDLSGQALDLNSLGSGVNFTYKVACQDGTIRNPR